MDFDRSQQQPKSSKEAQQSVMLKLCWDVASGPPGRARVYRERLSSPGSFAIQVGKPTMNSQGNSSWVSRRFSPWT